MHEEKNQAERPYLWLSEITTPGLLMQTDLSSGDTEPLYAGAAAPRRTNVLADLAPDFQAGLDRIADQLNGDDQGDQGDERPGLLLELASLKRRNCADFEQLIRPITEARTTSSAADIHAYFFGAGACDQQEEAKRLRLLSRELELTAAHIRRVLE